MKPHFIKFRGVWHCGILRGPRRQYLGLGFDAKEAFDDWEANR